MTLARLQEILAGFGRLHITVVGDLVLDRWGEVDRSLDEPSVETGLTAYQVTGRRQSAGAAGTVLNNLAALGIGDVQAVSMVGDDGEGFELLRLLEKAGIGTAGVVRRGDIFTPTYTKPMFSSPKNRAETEHNRFDIKNRRPTPPDAQQKLIANMQRAAAQSDALIVLDQLTEPDAGVVTAQMRAALAATAQKYPELLIFADSRAFADEFTGVTIKCNDKEARSLVLGPQHADDAFSHSAMSQCQHELRRRTGKRAVITCGSRGVLVEQKGASVLVPALPAPRVMDVCGCGDVCTSGMVSALCAGATWQEAAELGNLCASVTIRKIGQTGTSSQEEVLAQYRRFCKREDE